MNRSARTAETVSDVYLALMLSAFLLWTGPDGYTKILEAKYRLTVYLYYYEGYSAGEIAQLLELPPEDCAGVDDALAGVESARTAGMTAAAIGPAALAGAGDWNLECLSRLLDLCPPLEGGRDL